MKPVWAKGIISSWNKILSMQVEPFDSENAFDTKRDNQPHNCFFASKADCKWCLACLAARPRRRRNLYPQPSCSLELNILHFLVLGILPEIHSGCCFRHSLCADSLVLRL